MSKIVDEVINSIRTNPEEWEVTFSKEWIWLQKGGYSDGFYMGITTPPIRSLTPLTRLLASILTFGVIGLVWVLGIGLNFIRFQKDELPLSFFDQVRLSLLGEELIKGHMPLVANRALKRMKEIAEEAAENMKLK